MVTLRVLWLALATLCRVTWRRLRRGPLLPSWSFGLELITEIERAVISLLLPLDPRVLRKLAERAQPRTPLRKRVSREIIEENGVRGEWISPKQGPAGSVILYMHGGDNTCTQGHTTDNRSRGLLLCESVERE